MFHLEKIILLALLDVDATVSPHVPALVAFSTGHSALHACSYVTPRLAQPQNLHL